MELLTTPAARLYPPPDPQVSYCSRNISGIITPNHYEIIGPPVFIACGLFIGLLWLRVSAQRQSSRIAKQTRRHMAQDPDSRDDVDLRNQDEVRNLLGDLDFYTDFDREVLGRLEYDFNHARQLLRICVPCLISAVVTTSFIWLRGPIFSCLWPQRERASMNTALTCFLAPAGLVFALSFGFVFGQVREKHAAVYDKVANELSWLDQMLTMTANFNWPRREYPLAVLKAIKSELVLIGILVLNREPSSFINSSERNVKIHIWTVLDVLHRAAEHTESKFNLNSILADRMVDYLIHLNSICNDRMGALHMATHPLKWVFLEILAGITVFGMILVDASSNAAELALCELTVLSICMLFYLLADYDSPFNGFCRVTTAIIPEVVQRTATLYNGYLYELRVEQMREQMSACIKDKGEGQAWEDQGGADRVTPRTISIGASAFL